MITENKINKIGSISRKIKGQSFLNFPGNINPLELDLVGYLQGERVDFCRTLTSGNFESVSFISKSNNSSNGKPFIHAIGLLNGKTKILVFK